MNAICVFQDKKIKGKIRFTQEKREKPVQIELELQGFPKKKKPSDYAIHIHEFGDLSNGCMSTGGHFNPYDKIHGIIHPEYHIGDFISNITPNQNGDVFFQRNEPLLSLFPDEENCILGRSIVIHEYPDDLGDWKKYKTMGEKELLEFVLK